MQNLINEVSHLSNSAEVRIFATRPLLWDPLGLCTSVGNNTILWSGNHIGHHSKIGNNCFISSHVVISGNCIVGDNTFIGVNSSIADRTNIGKSCFIGMGVNITKDIDDEAKVTIKNNSQYL